jgi:nitrate reductase delta subunit
MRNAQEERYRVIAALLQYPDPEWLEMIAEVKAYCRRLPAGRTRETIGAFLDYLASRPLLRLQETYTAAFDLNPATTLNMSWHLSEDGRKRAAMLASLQQGYRNAGYEGPADDLPDFLPAMVEFLAVCRAGRVPASFQRCLAGVEGLAQRLRLAAPAYADLLDLLAEDCSSHPAGCGESARADALKRRQMP